MKRNEIVAKCASKGERARMYTRAVKQRSERHEKIRDDETCRSDHAARALCAAIRDTVVPFVSSVRYTHLI